MGYAARLSDAAKAADKLARLKRWTAHLSDDQLKAVAGTDPALLTVLHALRPHLTEAPDAD